MNSPTDAARQVLDDHPANGYGVCLTCSPDGQPQPGYDHQKHQADQLAKAGLLRTPSAEAVVQALTVKGRSPAHHDEQIKRLRREWPTLANALDRLLTEHGHPPMRA